MADEIAIRKTIFKNELDYILESNEFYSQYKSELISCLFENPFSSSRQLLLKKEINDIGTLESEIKRVNNVAAFIGDIKSIFIVQDDLEMHPELKRIISENEKLGVFVGAGMSKLVGYPLWDELANNAIKYLYEQMNLINYYEYKRITNDIRDPKQRLTIFESLLPRKERKAIDFFERELGNAGNYKNGNPYTYLVKIGSLKLTSNIDDQFYSAIHNYKQQMFDELNRDKSVEEEKVIKFVPPHRIWDGFDYQSINDDSIYYIHGHIKNLGGAVLNFQDYVEAYYTGQDPRGLKQFLREIFREYSIVFVGYGLEEFTVLEHLIGNSNQHYALVGTYLNEMNYFRLQSEYYKSLGIVAMPYFLDFNGYYRINSVLESWINIIEETKGRGYIDKEIELLKLIKSEEGNP